MKKTFLFAMLGLVLAGTALESCKKGADDPAISFRSRKGRFAGEWKMTKGTSEVNNGSTLFNYTYDGTTQVTTPPGSSTPFTVAFSSAKDGSFTLTTAYGSGSFATTIVEKGRWNFIGKIGSDFKNKDHVILYIDSKATTFGSSTTTDTYTGDQNSEVWYLDELRNKEMRIMTKYNHSNGTTTEYQNDDFTFAQ